MTIGIVGIKRGMTRVFTEDGASIPVTVIEATPNRITQMKSEESDGYMAILAFGFCVVALCHVLFLMNPDRFAASLRPAAEAYIFAVLLAQIAGFADAIRWGVLL